MIDLSNGELRINKDLIVDQNYKFDDFKKTKFYAGQDGIKIIYLDQVQKINEENFFVSLFFRKNKLYNVSLIHEDQQISESNEKHRKRIHDKVLEENNLLNNVDYDWGRVISEYDARSNISSMDIFYTQ